MTIKDALAEKVWAVIGATHKTDKFGYKIYKCLKEHGYEVYPVNPNVTSIDGDTCYPSLSALPVVPSVVDFVVPEAAGLAAIDECKQLGIPYCLNSQLMNVSNWELRQYGYNPVRINQQS